MTTPRPYPAYKPSAVPWLGDVPEHWEVRKLGQMGSLAKGNGGTKEDEALAGVPCVRYGDLYTTHTFFIEKARSFVGPETAKNYTLIRLGDVLFAGSGETIDEIGKSAVNLMQPPACCGGDVILFRPQRDLVARYMGYVTDCKPIAAQKATMGRGITVYHIYGSQLRHLTLPLPPLPEQSAIVRYLDFADRRIRRYVSAKRKLIALLEEEKQAVVNRAVTRGLDPNVRLKPSGVEWLGDVPEHWEVLRARFLFREVDTRSATGRETHLSMSQALGLVPSHLVAQSLISDSYVGGKLCREGDLVLNRLKAHLGVFALAKQSGVISPDYSVFRNRSSVKMEYFLPVLRLPALRTELRVRAKGIVEGFWRLYTEDFFDIRLPLPSSGEQQAIIEYLDKTTADVDTAIARARRQIELVEEYRTRLIADVVTGKLDVREAAAQLPEEPVEDDSIDEDRPLGDDMEEDLYGPDESAGEPVVEGEVTA